MSGVRAEARSVGVAVDYDNREKDDFYPTPPEGIEALLSVEEFSGAIWEPACGDGAISRVLIEHGYDVISTDLVDRGYGEPRIDFMMEWQPRAPNIVTNPPFKFVAEFMRQSLRLSTGKVAMLLRLACLEGAERREIFEATPLARVWVFSRRLQIWRGGIQDSHASGMIAFAWFVWDREHSGPPDLGWLLMSNPDREYDETADLAGSYQAVIAELRRRHLAGDRGWREWMGPKPPGYDVGAGLVRAGDEARYLPTGETVRVLDVVHDGEVLIQFPDDDERCEWVKWRFVVPLIEIGSTSANG